MLKIMGSDDRGVMFGLYRFASECLGVDPFYFWSGREPKKAEEKCWDGISISQGDPSFKFRGWFINDEVLLHTWKLDGSKDKPWEMAMAPNPKLTEKYPRHTGMPAFMPRAKSLHFNYLTLSHSGIFCYFTRFAAKSQPEKK